MIFIYPEDEQLYPTLGPEICDWIEENLCHGPGDLLGEPIALNDEQRAWIYRFYEIEPPTLESRKRGVVSRKKNPRAGRRRFNRCVLSLRKGSVKTELAAWIAAVELHPEGPVRCAGFDGDQPVPRPVTDPYIPMITYTEEQTEELAYGALRRILEESRAGADFDIGLERILRIGGDGKAEAVAGSPNARDGARTTFELADETHRFTLPKLRDAWKVMLANLAKRPAADPWALETTTAPEPGGGSVAESSMEHAKQMAESDRKGRLFFFHRQAEDSHDLDTEAGLRAALEEASGPYLSEWTDFDRIIAQFFEPDADRAYLERVWTNRLVQSARRAFDVERWKELATEFDVPDYAPIAIGFDGSRYHDATVAIATRVDTGFQWPIGFWQCPRNAKHWEVPVDEVDGMLTDAFDRWDVLRMYADPPYWESWIAEWAGRWGKKRVIEWFTNRRRPMAYAIRSFRSAIEAGEVSHDGDERVTDHIGNARRSQTNLVDHESGEQLWILKKERPGSPDKIDAAMAAVLSWEARNDALREGVMAVDELGVEFV